MGPCKVQLYGLYGHIWPKMGHGPWSLTSFLCSKKSYRDRLVGLLGRCFGYVEELNAAVSRG